MSPATPRSPIPDFALERYFARWEFAVRHLLCASDVEGYPMAELLALADDETRALWAELRLGYTEAAGHPLLRAEIAGLYRGIAPDDVLVFSGAEEAIYCTLSVLLGPGDHAIVVWPAYQSLHEVARASGAEVTLHELREADGWRLDPGRLVASFRPSTRVVVVNAPHNPTGMLPSAAEWAGLVEACDAAGVRLLADEVYRFLEHDPAHLIAAGAETGPRNASIGVMSKSFAMAGLRIGWLATRDRELLARVAAFKDYTTICPPGPSEILSIVALRARDRVLERSHRIVRANLALLDGFFERWADVVTWVRPVAGPVGFPRLVRQGDGGLPGGGIDALAADLVESEGVLLLPASQFGVDEHHFRLGFGREGFGEGLAAFERYLERTVRRA